FVGIAPRTENRRVAGSGAAHRSRDQESLDTYSTLRPAPFAIPGAAGPVPTGSPRRHRIGEAGAGMFAPDRTRGFHARRARERILSIFALSFRHTRLPQRPHHRPASHR